MKDNEQREIFRDLVASFEERHERLDRVLERIDTRLADLTRALAESTPAERQLSATAIVRFHQETCKQLARIQELCEAGRRFEGTRPPFVLPSPRVPLFVGWAIGALIFAAGMFAGTFLR
jgi:hypothetical protein